jgi:hypothetical protein
MRAWFKTKIARAVLIVAAVIALYAIAGFVIAPRVVRHELLTRVPESLPATSSVGEIRINPFLFQLEVQDFGLAGPKGDPLLGFKRLFVDFELSSLWHRAYSFARIEITDPFVNAVVAQDGTLNLAELHPKAGATPAPAPTTKSAPVPALRIGSFKVVHASIRYDDHSRQSEFSARLEPIDFELRDFTTGLAGGLFTFAGSSSLGERIEWHGHLSVAPVESDGQLSITGLKAHTLWAYLEDRLNFLINSGSIDVQASYKFALKEQPDLALEVASVAVTDLAVRARDADADWVDLPELKLRGASINLAQRQARVESLSLSGLKLLAWLSADRSVNLLELAASPPHAGEPAVPAKAPDTPSSALAAPTSAPAAAPWQFDLEEFELREASISAQDRSVQPVAKVLLAPLSLKLSGVSLDLTKPVKVALDTRINDTGSLAVEGEITPQPVAADLRVKLGAIDLSMAQPYIAQRTSVAVRGGKLGGEVRLRYGGAKSATALQASGDLFVEDLHTIDTARRDDLVNWSRLDVRGLDLQHSPDRLDIAEVAVRKPYARVIIEPDTSLNVANALKSSSAVESARAPVDATPAASPPRAPGKRGGASGAAPVVAGPAQGSLPMSIKKVVVESGQVSFTDLSIKPNFSAAIQNLKGSVLGLSSRPSSRATVDLHGNVDEFSPVSITGQVNILSPVLYSDLAMDFRNMELSIFNPYSGKFAGYNITKGKLTTELHYKVAGRNLDAQHHIVVDQLEFGDKTDSKDAVSLPVKLAVALLKDRHGVIDLTLPVTGSLDDPKFRIWPVIRHVLVTLLEKAVTAPFALLGSLFGGGPDLQFIDFKPGQGTVDAAEANKVKAIAQALKERPQLKLEVPIAVVPALDQPALAEARFASKVQELLATGEPRKKGAAAAPPADYAALEPAAKLEVLSRLYERELGGPPKYPDNVVQGKQKPEVASAKIDFLTSALKERFAANADDLKTLGQARALALQQALLTDTGVEPERVFLVANDKASEKQGAVRLELSLR